MGAGASKYKEVKGKHYDATVEKIPSQKGKVIAITGCTSGTGYALALTVAIKGGDIIMLNRASERSAAALDKVKAFIAEIESESKCCQIACDLQDFASVRAAAAKIKEQFPAGIDVLCNNAGIMMFPDKATKDGYDLQIQTNHLSHFLLTKELFPLLNRKAEAVGEARVVNHSSIAAWMGNAALEEQYFGKNGGNLGGDGSQAFSINNPSCKRYQQSKLANMVFTTVLADKLKAASSKVKAGVAHPGVSATNLFTHMTGAGLMKAVMCQSVGDGALGIILCCLKPDVEPLSYYGPNGMKGAAVALPLKPTCTDDKAKAMLWEASVAITGPFFEGGETAAASAASEAPAAAAASADAET